MTLPPQYPQGNMAGWKKSTPDKNNLLPSEESEENDGDEGTPEQESCCKHLWRRMFPTGYCWELKGTMSIGWPLILTEASPVLFQPIATMFGGHLGKVELDAISLANMIINTLGMSIVLGFATSLSTVFSQAFGNGNYKMIGGYLQKGLILHLLLLMPCYALHLNLKPILLALGQPEAVVELTSQYLLYFMPGLFFISMMTALQCFTQCQNDVTPHIIIAIIGHTVHALLQYLLLYQFKFGILGSSIAQASTFGVMCISTLIYTVCSKAYIRSWDGWSRDCLLDWGPLAALGLFAMLMVCLEWWSMEVTILLAGYKGTTELAAVNIPFHLNSIFFGLIRGLPKATGIRIGQFLGAANKEAALCAARVGMTITATGGAFCTMLFIIARSELPKLFTRETDVIELVSELMPLLAIFTFCDAIAVVGRNIFRGVGRQKLGTIIVFVAYDIVALLVAVPITLLTALSIRGIWMGYAIGSFICAMSYIIVVNFVFDWDKLEKEALERVREKTSLTEKQDDNENKYLLQGSVNQSAPDAVYIPKSLYVKRAATIAFFILLPIVGLIIRLVTQTGTTPDLQGIYNSTMTHINSTGFSTLA